MTRVMLPACVAIAGVVACSHPSEKPLEAERRFVQTVYSNADTETFTRTTQHINGTIVNRHETLSYRAAVGKDGLISAIEITASARGMSIKRLYPLPKNTMPMIGGSTALLEQILRRARVVGGDSISIPTLLVGANPTSNVFTVVSNGPDSLMIFDRTGDEKMAFHLAVDSTWHITGGVIPVDKLTIQPL
jgi:hypothetical protein